MQNCSAAALGFDPQDARSCSCLRNTLATLSVMSLVENTVLPNLHLPSRKNLHTTMLGGGDVTQRGADSVPRQFEPLVERQ